MAIAKRTADSSAERPLKKARTLDAPASAPKKPSANPVFTSALVADETDFPRGGGTSLTPLELKETREAGRKQADSEVAAVRKGRQTVNQANEEAEQERKAKQQQRVKRDGKKKKDPVEEAAKAEREKDSIRVESINYKRLLPGTKLLARVHSILPLHLILSLPNQLLAHVPITEISDTLTRLLEAGERSTIEDAGEDEEEPVAPELVQLFRPGQYVTGIVSATHIASNSAKEFTSLYPPTETIRLASKVEMSLAPAKVNAGVLLDDMVLRKSKAKGKDQQQGGAWKMTGEVKEEEDNGWRIELGVEGVEGFLPRDKTGGQPVQLGQLVDVVINQLAAGSRIAQVSIEEAAIKRATLVEASNVASVLPGQLVSALITAVIPSSGLNVKICGFYDGTIDITHLGLGGADIEDVYKIGKRVRARIVNDFLGVTPKRFALSVLPHILELGSPQADGKPLEIAVPIGTVLENVEVVRVVKEFGLVCRTKQGAHAFVHISHVKDDANIVLSTREGPYQVGSTHKARVLEHSPFDGTIILSLQKSVLEQRFMLVSELQVGEVIKGTIKRLTDKALFVNLQGSVDGMVSPIHYADIQLKHPEKRFKPDATVKCRILYIEPEKNRILLTLKKTLVESKQELPHSFADVREGMVTSGVIAKVLDKGLLVELFGGAKAFVPISEVSDSFVADLSQLYSVGKPISVRITVVSAADQRVTASIRQALPTFAAAKAIEIGDVVEGKITEVHKEQIVLTLEPSQSRALLSIGNEANHRGVAMTDVRSTLKLGEAVSDLLVVARNAENGILVVAHKAKSRQTEGGAGLQRLSLSTIEAGQILPARVISIKDHGAYLQVARNVKGRLHKTDMTDDFALEVPSLSVGDVIKCCAVRVDAATHQLDLSIRPSRVNQAGPSKGVAVADPEINSLDDLKFGATVRGIVKSKSAAGVHVMLGRNVTARVQIREMFDDFVADWQSRFELGQVVKGKILSVDAGKQQVEMTLREKPSKASKKDVPVAGLSDFTVGYKVSTVVKRVEVYGMFLQIEGSRVSGLCHKSELSDKKKADSASALKSYREGDKVRAKITSIDTEKNKIAFGIKPSYFDDEDFEMAGSDLDDLDDVDSGEDQDQQSDEEDVEDNDEAEDDLDAEDADGLETDNEDASGSDDEEIFIPTSTAVKPPKAALAKAKSSDAPTPALRLASGFDWNGSTLDALNEGDSVDSDEDSDQSNEAAKVAHPAAAKKKTKGPRIDADRTAAIKDKQPESTADFERALLSQPNSSYLWVQFMSFQLELSEVSKAREIGRRALQAINFREEEEKLNIWIALLNLENLHGTPESLDKLFKEAVQYNDAKTVYLRMASILEQTEKNEAAEDIYKRAVKKFGAHADVWALFAEFYFHREDLEAARALLPRALKSLPPAEHAKTIEKFAIFEFRFGDAERGKTIYEGLIDRYPKELFRWNNYIDQLAKLGDIQGVRVLVDRALAQQRKVHKVKFLFKKLLSVETRIGDEAGQDRAKAKAREWVAQNASAE